MPTKQTLTRAFLAGGLFLVLLSIATAPSTDHNPPTPPPPPPPRVPRRLPDAQAVCSLHGRHEHGGFAVHHLRSAHADGTCRPWQKGIPFPAPCHPELQAVIAKGGAGQKSISCVTADALSPAPWPPTYATESRQSFDFVEKRFLQARWPYVLTKNDFGRLPKQPLPVLERASNLTCAVVGDTDALLKHEFGADIDAKDVVIRLNFAPVAGKEAHVGSRTDVDFSASADGIKTKLRGVPVVLNAMTARVIRQYFTEEVGKDTFLSAEAVTSFMAQYMCEIVRDPGPGSTGRPTVTWWSDLSKLPGDRYSEPTDGLLAIALAKASCGETHVYGFADAKGGEDLGHWPELEQAILEVMTEKGELFLHR